METKKTKKIIKSEDEIAAGRKKTIRNWIILISAIIAAALIMVFVGQLGTSGHSIAVVSLPCYANQDVTVFQDGVLYYDGASLHYVNAGGSIVWSYSLGTGASFSTSETHIIAWDDHQLAILDATGKSTYNRAMDEVIQFARIGRKHAAIVTGDNLNSTVHVKDLSGAQIDSETQSLDGLVMLDCGFYGDNDQYMWTIGYDYYAPVVSSIMQTYAVGTSSTGTAVINKHLPSKVIYVNDRINIFTTQQLYTYNYQGVEDPSGQMLVYGWRYLDHTEKRKGSYRILLAPTSQTGHEEGMNELRVLASNLDRRYTLPTACVGAAIDGDSVYAFSSQYMYSGKINAPRFYTHHIPLDDGRQVTGFIGLTDNGYAIIVSNNEIYSVTLPR